MNIECLLALACLSIYNLIHLPSVGSYYHPKSQEAMYKNLLVWERFGPLLPVVFIRVTIYHHFSVNMVKLKPFSRLFFRSIWQNITFQLTDNSNWDKLLVQSTNQVGGGSLRSFNYILVTLIQKKKCFRVIGPALIRDYFRPVSRLFPLANVTSFQADDLLFCYRWLLLEMKREFGFEDALRVMETLWASLPPSYPEGVGLSLYEEKFVVRSKFDLAAALTPKRPGEMTFSKMVSLRRRTSSAGLNIR